MYCKHFMTLFGDMMNICIIGNSKRLSVLEQNLKANHKVTVYRSADNLEDEILQDVVVLPVPTVDKNGFINLNGKSKITLESILERIPSNSLVISCGCCDKNNRVIDINKREDFTYLNAVPTAEGAIYYALENSEKSLFESKILITGFGHVAKLLSDRLEGLCRDITVSARSLKDLSYAEALSYKTIHISKLKSSIDKFDLIFQTVPNKLLTSEIIDCLNKNSIIIELSSKSVGTDYVYAESKGINVVHAPALPEKISPVTAGNILTKSVLSLIAEHK